MAWFIVGFILGVPVGMFIGALCQKEISGDDEIERKPYDKKNPYDYY